jgi:hypothetical protein
MNVDTLNIDMDEHDLARDEAFERLGEIEDDATRISHAHGLITAAICIMAPVVYTQSILELLDHMKVQAVEFDKALNGAHQ